MRPRAGSACFRLGAVCAATGAAARHGHPRHTRRALDWSPRCRENVGATWPRRGARQRDCPGHSAKTPEPRVAPVPARCLGEETDRASGALRQADPGSTPAGPVAGARPPLARAVGSATHRVGSAAGPWVGSWRRSPPWLREGAFAARSDPSFFNNTRGPICTFGSPVPYWLMDTIRPVSSDFHFLSILSISGS